MDDVPATCSDISDAATFCGAGKSYNADNAGSSCAADPCDSGTSGDVTTCCMDDVPAGPPAECTSLSSGSCAGTAGFRDFAQQAGVYCSADPCEASDYEDGGACCPAAGGLMSGFSLPPRVVSFSVSLSLPFHHYLSAHTHPPHRRLF